MEASRLFRRFVDADQLLLALEEEITEETSAAYDRVREIWARSIPKRVARGECIEGVSIKKVSERAISVYVPSNQSRFREGDTMRLNQGDITKYVEVSFEKEKGHYLLLRTNDFLSDEYQALLTAEPEGWYLDESYLDLSGFYLSAVEALRAEKYKKQKPVLSLLMGQTKPRINQERRQRITARLQDSDLNEGQKTALIHAYATESAYLIQGPPGTGKTHVLAELVRYLVEDGQTVLITSLTHRAIGNALNKVAALGCDAYGEYLVPGVKVGDPSRAAGLLYPNVTEFIQWSKPKGGYVVGATPFAARSEKSMNGARFDVIIFDEAGQVTLPLAVMAMLQGKRFIFIGDHKQLPPVMLSRRGQEIEDSSVFRVLCGRGFDTMLNLTYRMNKELTSWPSQAFYNGRLEAHESCRMLRLTEAEARGIPGGSHPKVFIPSFTGTQTVKNQLEAINIAKICGKLINNGLSPENIGIVTPFRVQGRAIRDELKKIMTEKQVRLIVTDTVERMQGQERDVIILSMATTNRSFVAHIADFYFQPQRLNVSVTRARKKLIIRGCPEVMNHFISHELEPWQEYYRQLIDSCVHVNG